MAEDDIAVFLMTVGNSSPVNTYNNPVLATIPNLLSSTSDRVKAG